MIELNSERAKSSESQLTLEVSLWFREEYPETPYRIDIAADMPLPPIHRGRLKVLHGRWSTGHCDLVIYATTKKYSGCHIELKTIRAGLRNTEHTRNQAEYHSGLRRNGYSAEFAVGFDMATEIIRKYMKKVKHEK